jgi:hypothetical protein
MTTATQTTADKNRHSYIGKKGDLRVELHFVDLNDGEGRQAALYIYKFNAHANGIYVGFAGLWRYAQRDALHRLIKPLSKQIYGFESKDSEFRVLDTVMDYLEDLKNHKPEPDQDKTLDEFLEDCEMEGLEFFVEDGMGNRIIN